MRPDLRMWRGEGDVVLLPTRGLGPTPRTTWSRLSDTIPPLEFEQQKGLGLGQHSLAGCSVRYIQCTITWLTSLQTISTPYIFSKQGNFLAGAK